MTVAAIAGAPDVRLDIGWVVSATARVLTRRALDLVIVGLPFLILPGIVSNLLPSELSVLRLAFGLPGLVYVGGASLLTYRELTGGARVGAGDAIGAGARRFGTLWGVGLISNLAMLVGALLLLVPGIIVGLAWMPASTAAMAEEKTAFEALDRAWQLTRGQRWRLFGLVCIGLAAIFGLLLLLVVIAALATLAFGADAAKAASNTVIAPLFAYGIQAIMTVGGAAAYTGLRRAKEGATGVAEVFA